MMRKAKNGSRRVRLGKVIIPRDTEALLNGADIREALKRHAAGDYGEVTPAEAAENERAAEGPREVVSLYPTLDGRTVFVETAWTGPVTTVLLIGRGGEGMRARLQQDVVASLNALIDPAGKEEGLLRHAAGVVRQWLNGNAGGNDDE